MSYVRIAEDMDAATFWQAPTFTERDLSEARTDAWNRGYVAGVLDSQEETQGYSERAAAEAYARGYANGSSDMANWWVGDFTSNFDAEPHGLPTLAVAFGVFLGAFAVVVGYLIAGVLF